METPTQTLLLGHAEMDQTHREFVELWQKTMEADKASFAGLLANLLDHTERHFAREEALMAASGFPAIGEHRSDHQRVLGEMTRFARRAAQGSSTLARAWLNEQIPGWFETHLRTMDSALAAHLSCHEG